MLPCRRASRTMSPAPGLELHQVTPNKGRAPDIRSPKPPGSHVAILKNQRKLASGTLPLVMPSDDAPTSRTSSARFYSGTPGGIKDDHGVRPDEGSGKLGGVFPIRRGQKWARIARTSRRFRLVPTSNVSLLVRNPARRKWEGTDPRMAPASTERFASALLST